MLFSRFAKTRLVTPDEALPGRATRPYAVPATHAVLGTPLEGPWPAGLEVAYFALGCFWGAERVFWQTPGVYSTAVGYQGGATPHPTYDEVCTGMTGHTEAVQVVYDPAVVSYRALVKRFLEAHDPTQGYRQGNDTGTQYRSALYWTTADQQATAEELRARLPAGARRPRVRLGDDRGGRRRGPGLLLRRGLPPAVPLQGPQRLLRPRRHRRHLPPLTNG